MNIISYENCLTWSWAFALESISRCSNYKFVRIQRKPGFQLDQDLLDFFALTLVQNVDSLKQIEDKKKVVCRMGGMYIDKNNPSTRHDNPLRECAAIIATNQELFEVAKKVNKNSFFIPNGVDLEIFKPKEGSKENRKFTIGFAGNINGRGIDYKGWIYYDQVMLTLLMECNHIECLFGHSQIPHSSMPKEFYHRLDCLILPSLSEGCSNVTMEALACGVPVLITKVGFHGENLIDGEDCLFIKRDPENIIKKVRELMADKILQNKLSANGRKFAEENHDIKDIAKRYDEVFSKII